MASIRPLCEFPTLRRGDRCSHCGWRLPRDFARAPRRNCPARIVVACRHLGELIREHRTQGNRCTRTRGVYACSLHAECVPMMPAVEGLACCEGCADHAT